MRTTAENGAQGLTTRPSYPQSGSSKRVTPSGAPARKQRHTTQGGFREKQMDQKVKLEKDQMHARHACIRQSA